MARQRIFDSHESLAQMYRDGMTLQEIGDRFGGTRERVRQILAKLGVSRGEGGQQVRAMKRFAIVADVQRSRREKRRAKLESQFGCDFETLMELGSGEYPLAAVRKHNRSPVDKFITQRRNAKFRGIDWNMTLTEWWRVWAESGKWDERGRGGYVMARLGDSGPYSVENVYITEAGQNVRDFHAVAENKARWRAAQASAIKKRPPS